MDDQEIITLFFERNQNAITETQQKYGAYLRTIADNILKNAEDTEECLSDTMLRAWDVIPPQKPVRLKLFLAKIIRNLAFDRYKSRTADKRGGGELNAILDELSECIADASDVEKELDGRALREALSAFVGALPAKDRRIFVRRYFYADPVEQIARELGITAGACSTALSRIRKKLRSYLEQEGFTL